MPISPDKRLRSWLHVCGSDRKANSEHLKLWIYVCLSWITSTPSASAQSSVKECMGIKIFPFENCHPSKSCSVSGDLEQ